MDDSTHLDPMAYRDALPTLMLSARRWLLHDAKKLPYYTDLTRRNGTLDSPEDVERLAAFDVAIAAANAHPGFGLGFALGDGWQGIDLDDCRDPQTGTLSTLAAAIVAECDSYTEASPSGRGVHIIGFGKPFESIGAASNDKGIEAYAGGRYFTVTAHALRNPGELADPASVVERLRRKFVRVNGSARSDDSAATDDELRETIRSGRRGVHNALTHLSARFAGRGMTADDITATLAGLLDGCEWKKHDRARWQKRHGELSNMAASAVAKFADPRKNQTRAPDDDAAPPVGETGAALLHAEVDPVRYRCNPWAAEGCNLLAGRPKLGKTTLLRQKSAAIGHGGTFFGAQCEQADVVFLSLEEGRRMMRRKLELARYTPEEIARVTFFYEWPRGKDGVLQILRYLDAHPEATYWVVDSLTKFRQLPDARTPAFMCDYEAMSELHGITKARAGLCIDVLHHTRKMKSEEGL